MSRIDFILIDPQSARADPPRRPGCYEFRCWPRGPHGAFAHLQSRWRPIGAAMREDIYLLGPAGRALVKLRDGKRLEIKRLRADFGLLQYWTRPVSTDFPLDRDALRSLSPALGTRAVLEPGAGRSAAHLLAACWAASGQISVVAVRKTRLVFRRHGREVELTRAAWDGRRATSIAIEDPDGERAAMTVRELGLADFANLSYADVLRPRRLPVPRPAVGRA